MTASEPAAPTWGNTLRIRAEVRMTGQRVRSGFLHLQPHASVHSGPETPEDMLNRPVGFFPLTGEDERTVFVAKEQVLAVTLAGEPLFDDPDRIHAARTTGLRIELSDGSELVGTAALELPPTRSRALDFLNEGSGFFAIHALEVVHLVNRRQIRLVTSLD
jgi:hypothetical protein